MLNRRSFIRKAAPATAFLLAAKSIPAIAGKPETDGHKLEKIGFISGIIEKELKSDWKATLKKTAEFGYREIETGDYWGNSAREFLDYCLDTGIRPVAGGIGFSMAGNDLLPALEKLRNLGVDHAVVYWPWLTGGPFTLEDCRKSADLLNQIGNRCRQFGLELCWHNHNKEFSAMEEGLPFDYLMTHTDPKLVKCEMDVYWVRKGGGDPLALLKKYKGRFSILHLKDMAPGPEQDFACPGSGIIDFRPVLSEAVNQGVKHFMVERDNVSDGLACLESSSVHLLNLRF